MQEVIFFFGCGFHALYFTDFSLIHRIEILQMEVVLQCLIFLRSVVAFLMGDSDRVQIYAFSSL